MARVNYHLNGLKALQKGLLDRVTKEDVIKVVKTNTTEIQQSAMSKASSVYVKGYSTGATKQSIGISFEDNGMSGVTGLGMEYNEYTELGTRFMAAEPLLKPTFNSQKSKFKSDLEKLMK